MPPFQEKILSPPEMTCQPTRKIFFSHLPQNWKFDVYLIFAPSAAPHWPVPPQIFSSFIHIYQKFHLFNVNLTIFDVNANIFYEVPPRRPLRKCRPRRLAPSDSPRYATVFLSRWSFTDLKQLPCNEACKTCARQMSRVSAAAVVTTPTSKTLTLST